MSRETVIQLTNDICCIFLLKPVCLILVYFLFINIICWLREIGLQRRLNPPAALMHAKSNNLKKNYYDRKNSTISQIRVALIRVYSAGGDEPDPGDTRVRHTGEFIHVLTCMDNINMSLCIC